MDFPCGRLDADGGGGGGIVCGLEKGGGSRGMVERGVGSAQLTQEPETDPGAGGDGGGGVAAENGFVNGAGGGVIAEEQFRVALGLQGFVAESGCEPGSFGEMGDGVVHQGRIAGGERSLADEHGIMGALRGGEGLWVDCLL